jgi:queuine tRNA-ribosyltransferase
MPTRNARNGHLFVPTGHLNIANTLHRDDRSPVDADCSCEACQRYSRGYLAHLFRAKEILYYRLATLHNLNYYLNLVRGARRAITEGRLDSYVAERLATMEAKAE